jgi:hypothetical protein
VELFGGIAGLVLDPCYHQKCDTIDSIRGPGMHILKQNVEALAHVFHTFALEPEVDLVLHGLKKIKNI